MRLRAIRANARALVIVGVASLGLISCVDDTTPTVIPNHLDPSHALANSATKDSIANRYIIILKSDVPDALGESDRILAATGGHRKFLYSNVFKGFSVGDLPAGAIEKLKANPRIAHIEPVTYEHVVGTQSTGSSTHLWALDRIDQRSSTLTGAYTYGFSGSGVRVYVLDTGIDPDRAEFAGRLAAGATIVGGRSDGLEDADGHGTSMASLAGGSIHGSAKAATLIPVRVGIDGQNIGQDQVVAGLDWIYANGVAPAVVTYSISNLGDASCQIFGEGCNAVRYAVQGLWDRGIATVHAAGNDHNDACSHYVNRSSKVIVAGGTTPEATDGWPSWIANYGSCITLDAPAVNVGFITHGSDGETYADGTSIAAPLVAGVIAQILQERPTASPDLIKSVLVQSATSIPLNNAPNSYLFDNNPDPKLLLNSWHRWLSDIGGPGWVYTNIDQNATYSVDRLGGDGSWTYQWWVSIDNGPEQLVSTSPTYTRLVHANETYWLYVRVSATSAGETVSRYLSTRFEAPGCGTEICRP